jgi:hypothetical protein
LGARDEHVAPTILEAAHLPQPVSVNGVQQNDQGDRAAGHAFERLLGASV